MKPNKIFQPFGLCFVLFVVFAGQFSCKPTTKPEELTRETKQSNPKVEANQQNKTIANMKDKVPASSSGTGAKSTTLIVGVPLGLPPLPVPDDNPMTPEKIELGRKLYFDKRLSRDGTISCATCHDPAIAWAEHRPTSEGILGQVGKTNSPTIINSAYARVQFWDGRADSLEAQALDSIENPVSMGHNLDLLVKELAEIPEYKEGFQNVFGTGVTKDGIAKAISAFERTILGGNSPYDRFNAGQADALTKAQKRGMELFEDVGCSNCHIPPLFSNYRYYNAGIGMKKAKPDEGRKAVTGKERDLGKFRVPPLREVANTAPYYHDGSVPTLEEAVEIMAIGGKDSPRVSGMLKSLRGENISAQDKKDLVEFLKALSGEYPKK